MLWRETGMANVQKSQEHIDSSPVEVLIQQMSEESMDRSRCHLEDLDKDSSI